MSAQLFDLSSRYRAFRCEELKLRYVAKTGKNKPKRAKVITKAFREHLSGCFCGDWLAFLKWIGESPHADDPVVTAIPEPDLKLPDSSQIDAIAAETGIPKAQVSKVLGISVENRSAVEDRISACRDFWAEFTAIHREHQIADGSLWGLVSEGGYGGFFYTTYVQGKDGDIRELNDYRLKPVGLGKP